MAENPEKRMRTKQKLTDALVELCEEKHYYDITVWDICNKAQLYRSTFYRYFEKKDDMLREIDAVAAKTGRTRNEFMSMCLEFAMDHLEIEER